MLALLLTTVCLTIYLALLCLPPQAGMHTTPPATRKNLHLNRGRFSLTNLSPYFNTISKREKCDLLRCPETKTNLLRFSIECARLPIQQRDKRTKFCSAVTVSSVKKTLEQLREGYMDLFFNSYKLSKKTTPLIQ